MRKLLIGLTGRAGSGKTTAAEHIAGEFCFNEYALAQPIKEAVATLFGQDIGFAQGEAKEAVIPWLGKSSRQLQQLLGTEWGRKLVHPDIWLLLAEREWCRTLTGPAKGLVIGDIRFDNEAKWIKRNGGYIINVFREGVQPVVTHESENGIDPYLIDIWVDNSGSLEGFAQELEHYVRQFQLYGMTP
ncbi:deoxynucleotide monophosphate kinase [Pseudomonas luteola]|uniref:deoxynucleotide monophosphate kinase family protein n=1 Tax=Pseudomonas luteola TaxID=47886 RepID=UPI003A83787F